tara:strand:- start:195 stop:323 length:129 start_codon:yes stop_codon:yes gene_type:complete
VHLTLPLKLPNIEKIFVLLFVCMFNAAGKIIFGNGAASVNTY